MHALRRSLLRCGIQARNISTKEVTEVTIPVPWGHLAGKWWGTRDKQPILALHGVQDNAASFDRLIPLLDTGGIPIFAVDVPGHGKSDRIPPGYLPHYTDVLLILRFLIKDVFKGWGRMNFLSHSFGSSVCFAYAGIFPGEVQSFVSIECARLFMTNNRPEKLRGTIDKVIKYSRKTEVEPPSDTYDQMLSKFYKGRKGRVTMDSSQVLLSRGLTKSTLSKDKFYYSRDYVTRLPALGLFSVDYWNELASRITCNTLIIKAENGLFWKKCPMRDEFVNQAKLIEKNVPEFEYAFVTEGGHHVHIDAPEKVAPVINSFYAKGVLVGKESALNQ
ncbi:probable serine hydrolase isoform X1 [Nilaparvata lugens]|uniref:probable serine hydrolase isoform X1 n=1 Tax=Nilaparvata lugens TaxID=108931 RepID=UPI00193E9E1E|nr:probable serine hydrolase isoform X1 [Nilaparvata lugens]